MVLTGGCQCGAVRYEIAQEPLAVYVCHCRECQKQSASATNRAAISAVSGGRSCRSRSSGEVSGQT